MQNKLDLSSFANFIQEFYPRHVVQDFMSDQTDRSQRLIFWINEFKIWYNTRKR